MWTTPDPDMPLRPPAGPTAGESAFAARRSAGATAGHHAIDIRASVPLFGGHYYVTILAGKERRNRARLKLEGQTHWTRQLIIYLLIASMLLALATGYLVILYLIKCALGINLMSGSSPLHFIYEIVFE